MCSIPPHSNPLPQGEGATLPRAEVRSGSDLMRQAKVPPLLGERVGVRENEIHDS